MSNLSEIQKQIKAFNKALSRAEKKGVLKGDYYKKINDLIDIDRMTKSGYAMSGTKYLENMTYKDLMSYQADITAARETLDLASIVDEIDIEAAPDVKGALWQMFNKLADNSLLLDSDQVHDVEMGNVNIDYRKMLRQMNRYLNDPNYLLADFDAWWDKEKEKSLQ